MTTGIEKINFFTPPYYIEMDDLAAARQIDPNKFKIGIGQDQMAVSPLPYDSVALAINAAMGLELSAADKHAIDTIILATETGVDHSKAGSTWVHQALELPPYVRAVEMKQACYSATAALQLALGHLQLHPDKKVLIIASDIANYGVKTAGEPTQGAGAVAILLSNDAKIMQLETESMPYTREISDFWRPLYADVPFVDGKYSNEAYVKTFSGAWQGYKQLTGRIASDFDALLFHVPYTKMGKKSLQALDEAGELTADLYDQFLAAYEKATLYNRQVGNLYTGSLYLSLLSFLEHAQAAQAGELIGLFSYGSGAVGEFFAGKLLPDFEKYVHPARTQKLLAARHRLPITTYENLLSERITVDDAGNWQPDATYIQPGDFVLQKITAHQRQYGRA